MKLRQQGFTLIELAIVMLVLTILAAGLLVPLTANIESGRYTATQKILEEAKEALIGFAMSHPVNNPSSFICTCNYDASNSLIQSGPTSSSCYPSSFLPVEKCPPSSTTSPIQIRTQGPHYLPCPDKTSAFGINDSTHQPNDGKEDRNGSACEAQEGNLPWVDLGVGKADAWGNHLHYSVSAAFSDSTSGFTSASSGDKIICLSASCTTKIAENLPAVILSYGKNGRGAIHDDLLATPQVAPSSADERENIDIRTTLDPTCCKSLLPPLSGTNDHYVSRAPSEASATTTEFDDLVVWLPTALLVSRVCPSGGCP
jgi:prepilin-type N-terminal cleavage/methylation domain-containing protein